MGIELILRLSYLDDAKHYELSVNDFDQKKIDVDKNFEIQDINFKC